MLRVPSAKAGMVSMYLAKWKEYRDSRLTHQGQGVCFIFPSFTLTFPVARTVQAWFAWQGRGLACFVNSTVGFGQGWLE